MQRRTKNNQKPIINPYIYRVVGLVVVGILLFSAMMAGIWAFQSGALSARNILKTKNETSYSVELTKYLEGDETVRINMTGYDLYRKARGEETSDVKINGSILYTSGSGADAGEITVADLVPGDYYFKEVVRAPGYDLPAGADAIQEFTISEDGTDAVEVNFYNKKVFGFLTVSKEVRNSDDTPLTPEQTAREFTYTLTIGDGSDTTTAYELLKNGVVAGTIRSGETFTLKHGEIVRINGLAETIAYQVVETAVDGYTETSENSSGNILLTGSAASFVNTCIVDPDAVGDLAIKKEVTGGGDLDKEFDFYPVIGDASDTTTEYRYQINGTGSDVVFRNGDKIVLKHGDQVVFSDLPVGTDYLVMEDDYVPDGYVTTSTNASGTIVTPGVTALVENRKEAVEAGTYGPLTVTKEVTGDDSDEDQLFDFHITLGNPADTATAYVYSINGGTDETFHNGDVIQLMHGDELVFVDLPAGIPYVVVEDGLDYEVSSTGSVGTIVVDGGHAAFVNHKEVEEEETGELAIVKKVEGEGADLSKLFKFLVEFDSTDGYGWSIDGVLQPGTIGSGDTVQLKHGQVVTIHEIPVGTGYRVTEADYAGAYYIRSELKNGEGNMTLGAIQVEQVNIYVAPVFTEIKGVKYWDHGENPADQRPSQIVVILKADGIEVERKTVTAADNWAYSFNVPKYQADGVTEVVYTIEEAAINGYEAVVEGYDITNTFVGEVAPTDEPTDEPTGEPTDEPTGEPSDEPTVEPTDEPNGEPTDEPTDEPTGEPTDEPTDEPTVTPDPDDEVIDIKVTKVWDDGNNPERPDSVDVQLMKDGEESGKAITLDEENHWSHTWKDMDADAKWSLDELTVLEDYTKSISGNAKDGFVITNHKPHDPDEDEMVTIEGHKTWNHGDHPSSAWPEYITLYIYDGDTLVLTDRIDESDHWSWNYKLPMYRENGNKARYRVDEATIDGYDKSISGYSLTNNYSIYDVDGEKTLISGSKTWSHGKAPDSAKPESIVVLIKDGSKVVVEKTITADDHWKWEVSLPKYYADGSLVNYTVEEGNVPYYTHKVFGHDITNTFKSLSYRGDSPEDGYGATFAGGRASAAKTGDASRVTFWAILALVSVNIVGVLLIVQRRKLDIRKRQRRKL